MMALVRVTAIIRGDIFHSYVEGANDAFGLINSDGYGYDYGRVGDNFYAGVDVDVAGDGDDCCKDCDDYSIGGDDLIYFIKMTMVLMLLIGELW
jgi:hypothetical protein